MKSIIMQRDGWVMLPFSKQDLLALKAYPEGQPVKFKPMGQKKPRSWQQIKWIHAVLEHTVDQIGERYPDLNTMARLKFFVKKEIRFFRSMVVDGDRVYVEVRSFSYDDLEDPIEAGQVFDDVKMVCAGLIGCAPAELEAKAKEESRLNVRGKR